MGSKADIAAGSAYVRLFLKDDMTRQLQKSLKSAGKSVSDFGAGVTKLGVGISAIGAGMLAPIAAGVKTFMDMGGAAVDAAARTGLSVEALSELGFAAGQTGTDMGTVEAAIRRLAKSDLARVGETAEETFSRVAASIAAIPDPMHRAAAAQKAFGKSGTMLLPMLSDMEALRAKARELGIVMSSEDAAAADDLGDAWDSLKSQGKTIFFQIGKAVAGPLKEFATRVSEIAVKVITWAKANGPLIAMFAKVAVVVVAAGAAILALGGVLTTIGSVMSGLATIVGIVLSPVGLLVAALVGGVAAWFKFSESGKAAFGVLKDMFGGIGDALAVGDLALAGEIAMTGLKEAFYTGMAAILERWGDWIKPLVEMFAGAMGAVQKRFVETSGFISDQLLKWAGEEGARGEAARTVLGVDPRQTTAADKATLQQIKAINYQRKALESGIVDYEFLARNNMLEPGTKVTPRGATGAPAGADMTYEEALARRKDLQEKLRNADSVGAGMAGVDEAREINEDLTKQALANVESNVAELLAAYGKLEGGGASGTAKELAKKRKQLIRDANEAAFWREWDLAGTPGAGPPGPPPPDGITGKATEPAITTYSAAAAQAAGQMGGGGPADKMVSSMDSMRKTMAELGIISKETHLSHREMTKAFEFYVASFMFG